MSDLFDEAESRYPGSLGFCLSFWTYFAGPDWIHLRRRTAAALQSLDEKALMEFGRWSQSGILNLFRAHQSSGPVALSRDWVDCLWNSWLYQQLLDTLGFAPPPGTNVCHFSPSHPSWDSIEGEYRRLAQGTVRLALAEGRLPYWKMILPLQAPELYLHPTLAARPRVLGEGEGPLRGCDLACGWGRIGLNLRFPPGWDWVLECCDLSDQGLEQIVHFAHVAGLSSRIRAVKCSVTKLPFPDEVFDFFLAFDIFEHLPNPELRQAIRELLRTAKVGAVLYAEIPLMAYNLAVTHVQNFTLEALIQLVTSVRHRGRCLKLSCYRPSNPAHFSFQVVQSRTTF